MSLKAVLTIRNIYYTENQKHALKVEGILSIVRRIDTTRRLFCVHDQINLQWHFPEDGTALIHLVRDLLVYHKIEIKGPDLKVINEPLPWM